MDDEGYLLEKVDILGEFWGPETPELVVGGFLVFDPSNKIELKLVRSLYKDSIEDLANFDADVDVIHGRLEGDKDCTLWSVFQTSFDGSGSVYVANTFAIGQHFTSSNEIVFSSMSARFTHVDEWMWPQATTFKTPSKENPRIVKYTHELPELLEVALDAIDAKLTLEYSFSESPGRQVSQRTKAILSHKTYFTLTPRKTWISVGLIAVFLNLKLFFLPASPSP